MAVYFTNAFVRLRHGAADLPAFQAHVAQVYGRSDIPVKDLSDDVKRVQNSTGVERSALLLFAAAAALASLVLVGQAFVRSTQAEADAVPVLNAMGLDPPALVIGLALPHVVTVVVAVVTAVATTYVPVGPVPDRAGSPARSGPRLPPATRLPAGRGDRGHRGDAAAMAVRRRLADAPEPRSSVTRAPDAGGRRRVRARRIRAGGRRGQPGPGAGRRAPWHGAGALGLGGGHRGRARGRRGGDVGRRHQRCARPPRPLGADLAARGRSDGPGPGRATHRPSPVCADLALVSRYAATVGARMSPSTRWTRSRVGELRRAPRPPAGSGTTRPCSAPGAPRCSGWASVTPCSDDSGGPPLRWSASA